MKYIAIAEDDLDDLGTAYETIQNAVDAAEDMARDDRKTYIVFQPIKSVRATVIVEDVTAPEPAKPKRTASLTRPQRRRIKCDGHIQKAIRSR